MNDLNLNILPPAVARDILIAEDKSKSLADNVCYRLTALVETGDGAKHAVVWLIDRVDGVRLGLKPNQATIHPTSTEEEE